MNVEFLDYLEDIVDAMEKAEILIDDVSYEEFESDFRINFAVVRALEIIGEATKRLPTEVREPFNDIPWRGMAGIRDRIAYGYDVVDLQIVWDVVKCDIPEIKPKIDKMLEDFEN